jgi:hypothetical protein
VARSHLVYVTLLCSLRFSLVGPSFAGGTEFSFFFFFTGSRTHSVWQPWHQAPCVTAENIFIVSRDLCIFVGITVTLVNKPQIRNRRIRLVTDKISQSSQLALCCVAAGICVSCRKSTKSDTSSRVEREETLANFFSVSSVATLPRRYVQPWTVENQNYYFMILPDGKRERDRAINSTEWHWTKKIPLLLFESNTVFVCLLLLPLVLQIALSAASTWICCHSLCVRDLKSLAVIAWEFLDWLSFVFLSTAELCCFLNIPLKSTDVSNWVLKNMPFSLFFWIRDLGVNLLK